jgi:hypothetical protein
MAPNWDTLLLFTVIDVFVVTTVASHSNPSPLPTLEVPHPSTCRKGKPRTTTALIRKLQSDSALSTSDNQKISNLNLIFKFATGRVRVTATTRNNFMFLQSMQYIVVGNCAGERFLPKFSTKRVDCAVTQRLEHASRELKQQKVVASPFSPRPKGLYVCCASMSCIALFRVNFHHMFHY